MKPNFINIARNKQTTGLGNVTKKDLMALTVGIPDRYGQIAIGNILGTLDDKVELNRRMIQTLEDMTRLLYREWFVHFRFPGHEDVKLVDSDLGLIPEGWSQTCLADEIDLVRVNVKPFENPYEEFDHYSIPVFDSRKLPMCEFGMEIKSNKYLVASKCIMISKLNPRFPRVWHIDRSNLERRAVARFRRYKANFWALVGARWAWPT